MSSTRRLTGVSPRQERGPGGGRGGSGVLKGETPDKEEGGGEQRGARGIGTPDPVGEIGLETAGS
jgi:hypothetical protein